MSREGKACVGMRTSVDGYESGSLADLGGREVAEKDVKIASQKRLRSELDYIDVLPSVLQSMDIVIACKRKVAHRYQTSSFPWPQAYNQSNKAPSNNPT